MDEQHRSAREDKTPIAPIEPMNDMKQNTGSVIDADALLTATIPQVDERFRHELDARLMSYLQAKQEELAHLAAAQDQEQSGRGGRKKATAYTELTRQPQRALPLPFPFASGLRRGAGRAASLAAGFTLLAVLFVALSALFQSRQPFGGNKPGMQGPGGSNSQIGPLTPTTVPRAPTPAPLLGLPPQPVSGSIRLLDMSFIDANTGWALGYFCGPLENCAPTIRKTIDGGQTWQALPRTGVTMQSAGNLLARRVHFANADDGWAYDPSLFTTHDGGQTWVDSGRTGSILDLASRDGTAWAVERTCPQQSGQCTRTVLTSGDDGHTWQPTAAQPRIRGPELQLVLASGNDAWFISWQHIEPVSPGSPHVPTLVATHDGGKSWQELADPCDPGNGSPQSRLSALDAGHLWEVCGSQPGAGGQDKALYFSSDGGQRWDLVSGYLPGARPTLPPPPATAIDTPDTRSPAMPSTPTPFTPFRPTQEVLQGLPYSGYINDITFISPQRGFLALGRGTLFRTDDGGRTWREAIPYEIADPLDGGVGPAFFVDSMHGWLAAQPGLFRTVDGGEHWGLYGSAADTNMAAPSPSVAPGTTPDTPDVPPTAAAQATWPTALPASTPPSTPTALETALPMATAQAAPSDASVSPTIAPMATLPAYASPSSSPIPCGQGWETATLPESATANGSTLLGTAAVLPDDIWAVGEARDFGARPSGVSSQELILHWGGKEWGRVPGASKDAQPGSFYRLMAVTALATDNVWAVGEYQSNNIAKDGQVLTSSTPLIEHWNGKEWVRIASPLPPGFNIQSGTSMLTGISAVSSSDVWAIGWYTNGGPDSIKTLTLHFNGQSWSMVPSPDPGSNESRFAGIAAISGADVWAVGLYYAQGAGGTKYSTLIEHWDGKAWSIAPTPQVGGLSAISAVSSSDVWAAGDSLLHWDGKEWAAEYVPGGGAEAGFYDITAITANDVWAVGYNRPTGSTGPGKPYLFHWDGTSLERIQSPITEDHQLNAVWGSRGDIWTVGFVAFEGVAAGKALMMHYNSRVGNAGNAPCLTPTPAK